jgi:hypothetical protein
MRSPWQKGVGLVREWRVVAAVGFPVLVAGETQPEGGLPKQLHRIPQITDCQSTVVENQSVCARAWESPQFPEHPMVEVEWVEFFCNLEAESAMDAAEAGADAITVVLDDLSFRMDAALGISQLEVVDVSPPVAAGEQREMVLFPYPQGYPSWRLARSVALGHVTAEEAVSLRNSYMKMTGRERRALDWYLKALNTPFEVDQFMFLWIALEVLLDSDDGALVEAPFKGRCGHEIAECPVCGKPTTQPVRGVSVRGYLQRFGATDVDASVLWKTRMMMHGRADLTQSGMEDLSRQVQVLRACVVGALKTRLAMEETDAPLVAAGSFAVRPEVAVGGALAIEERHLTGCTEI